MCGRGKPGRCQDRHVTWVEKRLSSSTGKQQRFFTPIQDLRRLRNPIWRGIVDLRIIYSRPRGLATRYRVAHGPSAVQEKLYTEDELYQYARGGRSGRPNAPRLPKLKTPVCANRVEADTEIGKDAW